MAVTSGQREKRWVLLKIPPCDKNGVCEVKWPKLQGRHAQNDKERQQRKESDMRGGLKDPESGEVAQGRGRPGRDRRPSQKRERWVSCVLID